MFATLIGCQRLTEMSFQILYLALCTTRVAHLDTTITQNCGYIHPSRLLEIYAVGP